MKHKIYIFALLLLTSCINLRVNYPDINFYDLSLPTEDNITIINVKNNIQIRDFTINRKYVGNRIYHTDGNIVKPYYYHRWLSDFNDLATDYIRTVFIKSQAFSEGVIENDAITQPDYILQGKIIDYQVVNNDNDTEDDIENYIILSINIIIYQTATITNNAANLKEIYTNNYSVKIERESNKAITIAPAFTKGMNQITVKLLYDVLSRISKDNK